jgi:NAD(P)-dependent dehydrogenase (short-subunit alcohol dehydrogenase family)
VIEPPAVGNGARIVVVTGASGRLGGVVARAFAEAGDRLALLGRRAAALEDLAAELPGGAARHLPIAVDLLDREAARAAAERVERELGPASVLLHLAGGYRGEAGLAETADDEWRAMLDVNLWPTLNALRAFLPQVRTAEHGRIVTVSTPFARAPLATGAAYSATKAAVEAMTLSVARELAGTRATANVVVVRTIGDAKPHHTRPAEIAAALRWLCSPEGGVVNGQLVPVLGRGLPAGL